ncbi:hypothetical protein L228DRAFT_33364 [Xylona heveae TC161]|uniref:ER-bound oxygenase mpaB/mpaB'/Rubber oxygenase catalytic domain-containing protein n=1 Tax=Xylona heveae (strain CBS 132557 / TC161) TaxID=1328760 RepID=A0A165A5W1_XYLHT|nr:hypothetical protein L228DRAFT_33364 [Xylona heveae TC161]KZF19996.1 hypothetical protein L228DRAFT_33364 [Xylona heveae TC161]
MESSIEIGKMASRHFFYQSSKKTQDAWGHRFNWTDEHLTSEQLYPLKYTYDELADECLDKLDGIPGSTAGDAGTNDKHSGPSRDLYALLRDNAESDKSLGKLWNQVHAIPDWVDWAQVARGQEVFYRYGGAALTGLAFQSLLGGMGATRVVETLARTGGFSTRVARRRLYETTQYVLQCTTSLEAIQPGGVGHISTIRVRLLHAAVRKRIMRLRKSRPDYYDVENWGIPINDLDCIATIETFSSNLIWLSFPRMGLYLREQEIEDYIALWRLIAWYSGTPTFPFESASKAKAVMESYQIAEIDPTETSKILANNIIKSLADQPPAYASKYYLYANARWLNGKELSDRLGLEHPSLYYWFLVMCQNLLFMSVCYSHRSVHYLDRRKIARVRKIFYAMIVEHKHGLGGTPSQFEFQYIPQYGIFTEKGEATEEALSLPGIERTVLKWFLKVVIVGALLWFCLVRLLNYYSRNLVYI